MWIVWPFNKKNFGSSRSVCADFSSFIEDKIGNFTIRDEKYLPHPKRAIFESVCVLLYSETDEEFREMVRGLAYELAFFQKNVGDKPLYPLGIETDRLQSADVEEDDLPSLVRANPAGRERYDSFKQMRDADWSGMRATMAKIKPKQSK